MSDDLRRELPDEVIDELWAGARTEEEIVAPVGLLSQLTKRLVERALEVALTLWATFSFTDNRLRVVAYKE